MKHAQTQGQETGLASLLEGTTPGPWRLLGCQVAGPDESISFGGPIRRYYRPVADCSSSLYTYAALNSEAVYLDNRSSHPNDNVRVPSWQEAEANARLIAAAPSLLAVNAQLVAALESANSAMISAQNSEEPDFDPIITANETALSAAGALEGQGNAGTSA